MRIAFYLAALALAATRLTAQVTPPCCSITAINAVTGVITGKVTSNNNAFQFKVTDRKTLLTLKVGQSVYANFTTHQVSINGRSACCTVVSIAATGKVAPAGPSAAVPARLGGAVVSDAVHAAFASRILALTVDPARTGGMEAHGSVLVGTTAGTNPQDAIQIALSSSNPQLVMFTSPAIAVVTPGTNLAKFTFLSAPVTSLTTVAITATWGASTRTEPFTILPPALIDIRVTPTTVASGMKAVGTLVFSGPPVPGSVAAALKSSNPAVVQVPASVALPADRTQVGFDVQAAGTGTSTPVEITATFGSGRNGPRSLTTSMTVWPLGLTVDGWCNSPCWPDPYLTVTLPAAAPAGGLALFFSGSTNAIWFPQGDAITIPAGQTIDSIEVRYGGGNFTSWPARSFPADVSYNGHLFHTHGLMVWPQGKPDLTIWKAVASDRFANDISTTGPTDGQPFSLCANVSQIGPHPDDPNSSFYWLTEAAGPTKLHVSYLNNHGIGHDFNLPIDFTYEGSYTYTSSACFLLAGLANVNDYYDIRLTADYDHQVNETNEGNNVRTLRITRRT